MPSRLVPAAVIGALALFIFVSLSSVSLAQSAPTIQEYGLSTNLTSVDAMAVDNSGSVWLVDTSSSTLGMLNVSSMAFEEHYLPMELILPNSQFTGISIDSSGFVWIADKGGNRILGFDEANNRFFKYDFPKELQLAPTSVIRSGDYLWIGMNMEIGKLDITDPQVPLTDYYVYSHVADLSDIKMDGAGNVWFVEYNAGKVGGYYVARDDTAEYTIPTGSSSYPTSLAVDSQKRLWFVESGSDKLGMFDTTTNSFREYPAPALDSLTSSLNRVAVDGDDNVWLTDTANGRLIKFYPAMNTSVPVYIGDKKSYPTFLSIGNDGNIWVVESGAKKLAKVRVDSMYMGTATPSVTSTPTPTSANQTATATAKPSPGFELIAGISALSVASCLVRRKK